MGAHTRHKEIIIRKALCELQRQDVLPVAGLGPFLEGAYVQPGQLVWKQLDCRRKTPEAAGRERLVRDGWSLSG